MSTDLPAPRQPLSPARLSAIRARVARTPSTPEGRALSDMLTEVERLRRPLTPNPLTPAETVAALELARGGTVIDASTRLRLSIHTVKTQLSHARKRARASTNAQLIALAFANGWLTHHDLTPGGDH